MCMRLTAIVSTPQCLNSGCHHFCWHSIAYNVQYLRIAIIKTEVTENITGAVVVAVKVKVQIAVIIAVVMIALTAAVVAIYISITDSLTMLVCDENIVHMHMLVAATNANVVTVAVWVVVHCAETNLKRPMRGRGNSNCAGRKNTWCDGDVILLKHLRSYDKSRKHLVNADLLRVRATCCEWTLLWSSIRHAKTGEKSSKK